MSTTLRRCSPPQLSACTAHATVIERVDEPALHLFTRRRANLRYSRQNLPTYVACQQLGSLQRRTPLRSMNFQFSNLLASGCAAGAPGCWVWRTSDVQIGPARRWTSLVLLLLVLAAALLALAGLQWKRPLEGVNTYFLLDRSDSVPSLQQDKAQKWMNEAARRKNTEDRA
jgi:hypothetical protein